MGIIGIVVQIPLTAGISDVTDPIRFVSGSRDNRPDLIPAGGDSLL